MGTFRLTWPWSHIILQNGENYDFWDNFWTDFSPKNDIRKHRLERLLPPHVKILQYLESYGPARHQVPLLSEFRALSETSNSAPEPLGF